MVVLIIDDDTLFCDLIARQCRSWGYEAVVVNNAEAALKLFDSDQPPHLIMSDWILPGISGIELCRKVKSQYQDGYYYFIMISGEVSASSKARALEAGADDFITKPVDSFELRARLEAGRKILSFEQNLKEHEFQVRLQCYQAIVDLAAKRDNETGAHLERMGEYSFLLADRLGQAPDYSESIRLFAPFHDIGKVGIPDNILLAPRKLTDAEFEIMKTHAVLGWEILKNVETMELAAELILAHHEKYDGSGYPYGLRGKEIPLSGRIVAIADVYDALRSERHYKASWPRQQVVELILKEAGGHFDPKIIEIFSQVEDEFNEIFVNISSSQKFPW